MIVWSARWHEQGSRRDAPSHVRSASMRPKTLAVILGIRPDVIRASIILQLLRSTDRCDLVLIWSGQHYSDNLKDVFFRELSVASPDV
jgi:UDP-N-acetylglucosamine 2-epimerase